MMEKSINKIKNLTVSEATARMVFGLKDQRFTFDSDYPSEIHYRIMYHPDFNRDDEKITKNQLIVWDQFGYDSTDEDSFCYWGLEFWSYKWACYLPAGEGDSWGLSDNWRFYGGEFGPDTIFPDMNFKKILSH